MKEAFVQLFEVHLRFHIAMIVLFTGAILVAMFVDLVTGVYKARQRGEATTSRGLKMTAKKAVKYLVPFFILCLLDLIAAFLLPAPFFSMPWTGYILWCEFWSVRESAWTKAEIQQQNNTIRAVIVSREDPNKMADVLLNPPTSPENAQEKTAA